MQQSGNTTYGSGIGYGSSPQGGGGYGQDNDASINPNLTAAGGKNAQSFGSSDPSNTGTFDDGSGDASYGSGTQQFGQGGQTDPNVSSNTFGSGASGVGKRNIGGDFMEGLRDSAGKVAGQARKVGGNQGSQGGQGGQGNQGYNF